VATYVLFCTDVPIPSDKTPDLRRVVSMNLDSMGAAIKEACRLISDGVIVWKIRGPDGFIMERISKPREDLSGYQAWQAQND
jgi:hypothetical protein